MEENVITVTKNVTVTRNVTVAENVTVTNHVSVDDLEGSVEEWLKGFVITDEVISLYSPYSFSSYENYIISGTITNTTGYSAVPESIVLFYYFYDENREYEDLELIHSYYRDLSDSFTFPLNPGESVSYSKKTDTRFSSKYKFYRAVWEVRFSNNPGIKQMPSMTQSVKNTNLQFIGELKLLILED